jgi:transposase
MDEEIEERFNLYERRKEAYKKAIELRKKGFKCREIANQLKIPLGTIKRWLCGISKPRTTKVSLKMLQEWKELRKRNVSVKTIAKMYKVHPTTVVSYSREIGIAKKKIAPKLPNKFIRKLINYVKKKKLQFLNYFYWKPLRLKDIKRFEVFLECLKLYLKGERFEHIDDKLHLPKGTAQAFVTGRCLPKIAHFFRIYTELGKPRKHHQWLNLNVRGAKLPEKPFIQVPMSVKNWSDVKGVIDQLAPINEAFERGKQFGFSPKDIEQNKYKFFGYFLGAIVGDCGKHKPKKGCKGNIHIELKLSKNHKSNLRFGEFVSLCANAIGLRMYRVKNPTDSSGNKFYLWRSQSSPLNTYIFNVLLGLKKNETTTYTPLRMNWIFTAPDEFKISFIQGVADSDGWVSIPKQEVGIESYPNSELIENLLKDIDIKSHQETTQEGNKFVVTKGFRQVKKAFQLPIFNPFVKSYRYTLLEKLANSRCLRFWPKWIYLKIWKYANEGRKPSEISRIMLEKYNVSIRADRISEKLKNKKI